MERQPGKQEKLEVKVRIANPDEWKDCKDLRIASITGPDATFLIGAPGVLEKEMQKTDEEWQKETNSEKMFAVLARSGSSAVGLGRTKMLEDGSWQVRNGYVKPEFRGQGIQPKMIALRLKEIIRRGGKKAMTGIRVENSVSLNNVEEFGFKVEEVDDGWAMMTLDLTLPEVFRKIEEILNEG